MGFEDEEVGCHKCGAVHKRKDGICRMHPDGSTIVSYCRTECFYSIAGHGVIQAIRGV
jgi:hypothetical protein